MRAVAVARGRLAGRPWRGVSGYVTLVAAAWLLLWAIQRSEHAWLFSHEVLGARGLAPALAVAGYMSGWILMSLAMMLPGELPTLAGVSANCSAWLAGYLSPWLLFGFAFGAVDLLVHVLVAPVHPQLVARAPAILWGAAGVQLLVRFVGARRRRSPRSGMKTSFARGWCEGRICLRRDWLLMLTVVGSGHGSLLVMAAATVVMSGQAMASVARWPQPAQ